MYNLNKKISLPEFELIYSKGKALDLLLIVSIFFSCNSNEKNITEFIPILICSNLKVIFELYPLKAK